MSNDLIFKETMKAFYDRSVNENELKMKDLNSEFLTLLKKSNRVDFQIYFIKKSDGRVSNYIENVLADLKDSSTRPPPIYAQQTNFLLNPAKKSFSENNGSQLYKGFASKAQRYEYKRLISFKKQIKHGILTRTEK